MKSLRRSSLQSVLNFLQRKLEMAGTDTVYQSPAQAERMLQTVAINITPTPYVVLSHTNRRQNLWRIHKGHPPPPPHPPFPPPIALSIGMMQTQWCKHKEECTPGPQW